MVETQDKYMTFTEAIKRFVRDGITLYLGGFSQNVSFAAAHEIIRQKRRDLTLTKPGGGIIFDQLIGTGCAKRLITSHVWNFVGPTPTHAFRRAVEKEVPNRIEVEEDSMFSLNMRYFAGANNLPFIPIRSIMGTDIFRLGKEKKYKVVECPFTGEKACLMAALKPDVGVIQVQRVDKKGNAQVWGARGDIKYGINACKKVIISAEEVVDTEVIRNDPNRTIIPHFKVDAIVEEPWGAHPQYIQGYYDRDLNYFALYGSETRTLDGFENFMDEWVYSVSDRKEYLKKVGPERLRQLRAKSKLSAPVNYGY